MARDRHELEDRGWEQMHTLLDREMPVERRRRRLVPWYFSAAAVLLVLIVATVAYRNMLSETDGTTPTLAEHAPTPTTPVATLDSVTGGVRPTVVSPAEILPADVLDFEKTRSITAETQRALVEVAHRPTSIAVPEGITSRFPIANRTEAQTTEITTADVPSVILNPPMVQPATTSIPSPDSGTEAEKVLTEITPVLPDSPAAIEQPQEAKITAISGSMPSFQTDSVQTARKRPTTLPAMAQPLAFGPKKEGRTELISPTTEAAPAEDELPTEVASPRTLLLAHTEPLASANGQPGFALGVRVLRPLSDGWNWRAGLNYRYQNVTQEVSSVSEIADLEGEVSSGVGFLDQTYTYTNEPTNLAVSSNGDFTAAATSLIQGGALVTDLHYLELPIGVRRSFKKFYAEAALRPAVLLAGVVDNEWTADGLFSRNQQGVAFDASGSVERASVAADAVNFVRPFQLSSDLRVGYRFGQRWSADVGWQYGLTPVVRGSQPGSGLVGAFSERAFDNLLRSDNRFSLGVNFRF